MRTWLRVLPTRTWSTSWSSAVPELTSSRKLAGRVTSNSPSVSVTVAGASKVPPPWVCVFPLMTTVIVSPGVAPV